MPSVGEHQDAGVQHGPGYLQHLHPHPDQRQVERQQHHVAHEQRRRSAPTPGRAEFSKSCGPGWRLKIWNAASITAAVAEVGRPRVSSGTSTPENDALFAASGPATPSIAPLPNSLDAGAALLVRCSDRNVGSSAPPEGSTPNGNPNARPPQPRAPRPAPLVAAEPHEPTAGGSSGVTCPGPGAAPDQDVQRLADREQADDQQHVVDAVEQRAVPKVKPRLARDAVQADEPDHDAEQQGQQARAPVSCRPVRSRSRAPGSSGRSSRSP